MFFDLALAAWESNMDRPLMVLGGGVAGLSAALSAARTGTPVVLVEKEARLGGHAAGFCCKATDRCAYCSACIADEILREVRDNPLVDVRLGTSVESIARNGDAFEAALSDGGNIEAAAVVVATGFEPFDPKSCRSATAMQPLPDIVSAIDIEKMLRDEGRIVQPSSANPPEKVAFIQCVGSRSRRFGSPECSRVCCPYAIRIARRLKWQQPDCEVSIFHMDLQAIRKIAVNMYDRFAGEIVFVRGIPSEAVAGKGGGAVLKYEDTATGEITKAQFDLVVLSVGIAPGPDAEAVAGLFGIERDAWGFLKPASAQEPCASEAKGVFLAGACSGPKDIRDSIAQGRAATHAALNWIKRKDG